MEKRRVVVTGLGCITPLGLDLASTWQGIVAGKSGVSKITDFDTTDFSVKIAATLPGFDPEAAGITRKEKKKMDISLQLGYAASIQAWEDAGIEVTEESSHRMGVSVGSGIGGLSCIQENQQNLIDDGPRKISPFFIPAAIINMISGHVAMRFGLKGPNIAIVTAFTTGTHHIGNAARMIAFGDADVMVAGGAEKASCPIGIAGFAAARALSKRNDDPEHASRPWDVGRDGFVLGDGAGAIVLEEYEHAKKRGAKIYAELVGFGMSADAYHITLPSGDGGYRSMQNALQDAKMDASEVDYVNAHGTSTPAGDAIESQSVAKLLGAQAKKACMSSTKSMIGHLLGAAGAVEAIFSVLSIHDNVVPPTMNLDNLDPECADMDYVANQAQQRQIDVAVSNSFGFGGTNGTLVFKRV